MLQEILTYIAIFPGTTMTIATWGRAKETHVRTSNRWWRWYIYKPVVNEQRLRGWLLLDFSVGYTENGAMPQNIPFLSRLLRLPLPPSSPFSVWEPLGKLSWLTARFIGRAPWPFAVEPED